MSDERKLNNRERMGLRMVSWIAEFLLRPSLDWNEKKPLEELMSDFRKALKDQI